MAEGEQVQKQTQETLARVEEEEVVVTDVPQAEKATTTTTVVEKVPPPVPETEEPTKPKPIKEEESEVEAADTEVSKSSGENVDEKTPLSVSFKEESTRVSDLPDTEKKALEELKQLIQEALNNHEFTTLPSPPSPPKEDQEKPAALEEKEKNPDEEKPSQVVAPEEAANSESETVAESKDEAQPEKEAETVVVSEVIEEKVAAENDTVDDDGAKTVEAIEETIVAVSSSVTQEQPPPSEAKDAEEKAAQPSVAEAEAEAEEKDVKVETLAALSPEEVSIYGVPLLADERSNVILLKFLRARDFKVKDAFAMIKNTVRWRKEFGIDELLEQDLGSDLDKVVFMHGFDKEGHPVCYNVYGEFQNKELYQKAFSDEEKRQRFLRWRIQFLERSIRKLDFKPGCISTIVQVNDLKNSPGPNKWELRQATKQALQLLQDNYPEFVAKQV